MGLLEAAHKTLLGAGVGNNIYVLDIELGGALRKWAAASFSSDTGGRYEGRIIEWGPITRGKSDRSGNLLSPEVTIKIADTDRLFARILEGTLAKTVKNSVGIVRLAHDQVAYADWSVRFTGVLAAWSFPEPMSAELTLRVNDLQLQRQSPKGAWSITLTDWPNAAEDVPGAYAPLLYGIHSSPGYTAQGAIKCPYIDTVGFRYLVCAGYAKSVDAVYLDGVVAAVADYTITYPVVKGKQYTLIDFTADQGDDVAVTADVQGYEAVGDGTGAVLTSPVDQIVHWLSNWVFGDYRSGAWLTSSRIDSTSVTALQSFLSDRGYVGARIIREAATAQNDLTSWLLSFELKAWWTSTGQLAFGVDDHTLESIYDQTFVSRNEQGFPLKYDDDRDTSAVTVSYIYLDAEGKFLQSLEVTTPDAMIDAADTLDMPWGPAS